MPQRQLFLAAYDVREPKRLQKALHVLRDYTCGGQKSVFECYLTVVLGEQLMAYGLAAGTSLRNKLFNDLHDLMEYWIQGDILQWLQRFAEVNDTLKRDFYSHQYNAISEKITLILTQLQEMLEQYALEQLHG